MSKFNLQLTTEKGIMYITQPSMFRLEKDWETWARFTFPATGIYTFTLNGITHTLRI